MTGGGAGGTRTVCWHGGRVISGGADGKMRVWDVDEGRIVKEETKEWVDKTEYAQMNVYTNARKRREIDWPKIPKDFEDFEPPVKKAKKKKKKGN